LGQETAGSPSVDVYYCEIRGRRGAGAPVTLKKSNFNTIQNKVVMIKRSLLISFFSRRRSLAFVFACASLPPLTSFAQQYQETDQVSNASGQGAQIVDPHLINPWGIARSST
jgi:hypothetical protein